MSVVVLLALLLVGLVVGFTSGLVGIGGGVLIVPFLYFFYAHPSWGGARVPESLHTYAAHATSLFVIIPTAIRGTLSYNKAGLVVWRAALPVAAASALATVGGVALQHALPSAIVRIAFGCFLLLTGLQLIWRPHETAPGPLRLHPAAIIGTGLAVGVLSGLMGIGGGAIAAALLIHFIGLDLKQAAATSLAIVGFAAVVGTLTNVVTGWGVQGMPLGSFGYVHLLAAVPILLGAVISVKAGTLANQRMPAARLKGVYATFFCLLGVYLIWQNVPAFH